MSLDLYLEKVNRSINNLSFYESEIKRLDESLVGLKKEQESLEKVVVKNTKAISIFITFFDKLNERGLSVLDTLLEGALASIYPDRNFSVRHLVKEERGSNQLNFFLLEKRDDGKEIISNMKDGTGGGIRAVAGLICTYFYLMKMGGERLIVLDEGLSQISDLRVESLFELIKSFGKESGFKMILISHDVRFRPFYDKEYRVSLDGTLNLVTFKE